MPPKSKESAKKPSPQAVRPAISSSSLIYVPEDAVEGFQERIETGIPWTLIEQAARYHKQRCQREEIPKKLFSDALEDKMKKSVLKGFLDEESGLSLEDQWELNLPITMWDVEKFGNEEEKICFNTANSITDDLLNIIKKVVLNGKRETLRKELKEILVLRVVDSKMTNLDKSLLDFRKLTTLNLCGNFLSEVDMGCLPRGLKALELQTNAIKNIEAFAQNLPDELMYLGLSRNLLTNEGLEALKILPQSIKVLDLSENDIYNVELVLDSLVWLRNLEGLLLAGNPCAYCAAYTKTILSRLPRLHWLDSREILAADAVTDPDPFEPHPDDLRANFFNFSTIRIMSAPQPPKPEKGVVATFHVELEIPLLDSERRQFLMFRDNDALTELLPPPEDEEWPPSKVSSSAVPTMSFIDGEQSPHPSDIYRHLETKNSREIRHYKTFESNRVQWNKIMNFQEPAVRIFCPDLRALRDTFRTNITIRLIYTVSYPPGKPSKSEKKSAQTLKAPPTEQRVVVAAVKCGLQRTDWSQPYQHFHWDDSMATDEALHWGDGNLAMVQYSQLPPKATKGKVETEITVKPPPENLTCHFSFGIDSVILS